MNKDEPLDRLLERASRADTDVRPAAPCLDAETLAAFSEGSLTADERTAAEAHLADCGRCLAVVAAIARTHPPPLVRSRPSWLSIRWLIPLTSAAAAITAWMIIQPPSTPPAPAPEAALEDTAKADRPTVQPQAKVAAAPTIDALEKKREAADTAQMKEQDRSRKPSTAVAESRAAAPAASAAAPAPNPPSRREAADERLQQRLSAVAPQPITIPSTDPSVRWRLTGHAVERSTDGGKTWTAQTTGVSVDLLAGASPSASVCWIVGRRGIVLLTTDGITWRRLDLPDASVDLVGVSAMDASTATVTTANGGRYRTADAGRTWTLQENPAAPF